MKEIEIKAYLKDKEFVLEKLQKLGCFLSEPITQTDTVFVQKTGPLDIYLSNDVFPRIRITGSGKNIFTVKKPISREILTKLEAEVEVSDSTKLSDALEMLGYNASNTVKKTRRKGNVGEFEICIDEVEGLGVFIEIERMSEGDHVSVREEIESFMRDLRIPVEDEVSKGYDILMIEKMYKS